MESFASYLLKSAAWLSGFAIIYFLFLRNERYFMLKRIYLITGILVSFAFPLITIHYPVEIPAAVFNQEEMTSGYVYSPSQAAIAEPDKFNYSVLAGGIYLAGIIILALRLIWQFHKLFRSIKGSKADLLGPARVIRASEYASSFSFFNYVFVNPSVSSNEIEEIMNHELVHVRQKHWLDLVLGELLRMLQWANPFAWIYTGFIRLNHEYLADQVALQKTSDPAVYKAALLNQVFSSPVISLSNSFNYSITKTRFDMMKKISSSPFRKLKVLLVLPVFAIIFYAFAAPEYRYIQSPEETGIILPAAHGQNKEIEAAGSVTSPGQSIVKGKVLKEDGSPLPGVVAVVSGISGRGISDMDGNFMINNVPRNSDITFTLKGYITQTQKAKPGKDIEVRMKKDPDHKDETVVIGYANSPGSAYLRNTNTSISDSVLVIIDGVRTDRNGLKELNPNSIESISVLKDLAAGRVYGDDGKNGVLIITTKKNQLVRGTVTDETGRPLANVNVTSTGTLGNARGASTDENGKFFLSNIQADASLNFFLRGYKSMSLKADFSNEMKVTMIKDPDFKEPFYSKAETKPATAPLPVTVLDGVITNEPVAVINSKLGDELGTIIRLAPKEAMEKYGEAGKNGATEIYTRKKAAELGIKIPFRRKYPEDFPTFQGGNQMKYSEFIAGQITYPSEAVSKGIEGRVSIGFTVEADGSISGIKPMGSSDPLLSAAVIRVIESSPKWEPARNPEAREPYSTFANVRFRLPDKVTLDDTYVVVEQMPMYPGGDKALLDYIAANAKYPESLKDEKISGRVIVRFVVNSQGKTEDAIVLKGVHPVLDAEAIKIINSIEGWKPGMQNGQPVNVWYMAPVNFTSEQK